MIRRTCTLSALGIRVMRSTGFSPITQTSAARAPSPIEMARTSGRSDVRQKPPGITRMPSGVAAAKTRRTNGAGERRSSFSTGMVESRTFSWPTKSAGRSRRLWIRSSRSAGVMSATIRDCDRMLSPPGALKAGAMARSSRRISTRACSAGWPHHQVATWGMGRSSPSNSWQRRGRKPIRARDSSTPEPGMLSTVTPPARMASSMPGVPSREALFSSSGSMKPESTRRRITSARFSPAMVRT